MRHVGPENVWFFCAWFCETCKVKSAKGKFTCFLVWICEIKAENGRNFLVAVANATHWTCLFKERRHSCNITHRSETNDSREFIFFDISSFLHGKKCCSLDARVLIAIFAKTNVVSGDVSVHTAFTIAMGKVVFYSIWIFFVSAWGKCLEFCFLWAKCRITLVSKYIYHGWSGVEKHGYLLLWVTHVDVSHVLLVVVVCEVDFTQPWWWLSSRNICRRNKNRTRALWFGWKRSRICWSSWRCLLSFFLDDYWCNYRRSLDSDSFTFCFDFILNIVHETNLGVSLHVQCYVRATVFFNFAPCVNAVI